MKKRNYTFPGRTATALVASLATTPVTTADENPFQIREVQRPAGTDQKLAQGMCGNCGGRWEGRCGGMMSGVMPRTLGPAELPEPEADGARLLTQYCTQCHDLPSPKQHSASGWPATVARMNMRMQWMSQSNSPMKIESPTADELHTLTAYLEKHAADPEAATAAAGVVASGSGQDVSSPVPKTATEILRECYARGEIEREEFLQRLEDLKER
tara:strand:- start:3722 stop:4360 length:639 start_codon:yes stop_codon:yes gene_type:complete